MTLRYLHRRVTQGKLLKECDPLYFALIFERECFILSKGTGEND